MYNLSIDLGKCKSRKKLTELRNNRVSMAVLGRLVNEALDRYSIEGLPDTCNERVILESMLFYGCVTFFDSDGSLLALPSVPSGDGYNIYGDPTSAWVFSRNGLFNREVKLFVQGGADYSLLNRGSSGLTLSSGQNGVMVWENKARMPFILNTCYYAESIADTLRTIDVNRKWLKRPFIPVCEESIVPSVKDLFEKMERNDEFIPVSTGVLDISRFDVKPIDISPEAVKSAIELCEWYENKYRELCGTDSNTQMDKKGENLIADEVHANDEYTGKQTSALVDYINQQMELVNSVFGVNIEAVDNQPEEEEEVNTDEQNNFSGTSE